MWIHRTFFALATVWLLFATVAAAGASPNPDVVRFYEARGLAPAWSGSAAAERNRALALAALARAADDGLDPDKYAVAGERDGDSAQADAALTAAMLQFAHDLRLGRLAPQEADRFVSLPRQSFDAVAALNGALVNNTFPRFLAALAPPNPEYRRLKRALAAYRAVQRNGGWAALPPAVTKPDRSERLIRALWERLALEDAPVRGEPTDEALDDAVRRFQTRHGLEPDGRVGPKTLAALNVPASERIAQIVANMERWRWLPRAFGTDYIAVNAAAATLTAVADGRVVVVSRIVAGKSSTPTPLFAATVEAVTANPYWNIPASIVRNEILPRERAHPGYLASQHIERGPDGQLRQIPGDFNALGRLKLEMPNRFNSYLHDTPAKSLFARADRHFSHGCMRVEQIRALASFALTRDAALGLLRLDAALASGQTVRIALDKPLPVYVLYWTVIAREDGTADFFPDVYGRDGRLLAALSGARHEIGGAALATECGPFAGSVSTRGNRGRV